MAITLPCSRFCQSVNFFKIWNINARFLYHNKILNFKFSPITKNNLKVKQNYLSFAALKNPNLETIQTDFLYHIDINISDTRNTDEIQARFGDVKFVCMGGTKNRMQDFAKYLRCLLQLDNEDLKDISAAGHRYAIFKVGPILCCSHGVGMSSMSVILHELLKLVHYAKCQDPIFIRLGTSGGICVEPGTVVITKDAYNGYLKNEQEISILGDRVARPANFDINVAEEILKCSEVTSNYKVIMGNTMTTECFYEGQGRIDGAICQYSDSDKMAFLQKCYENGIRNIEMEATMIASMTKYVCVKAAQVCVTLINRINGDQIVISKEQKQEFEQRPFLIVGTYMKKILDMK